MTDLHLEQVHEGVLYVFQDLVLPSGKLYPLALKREDADALTALLALRDAARVWAQSVRPLAETSVLSPESRVLLEAVEASGGETS